MLGYLSFAIGAAHLAEVPEEEEDELRIASSKLPKGLW
jgi:hypothetical protein